MIVKLTPEVWWGDKPSVQESLGEVKSIINVAHAIRRPYWKDLGNLDWRVWYLRLALPDREPVDDMYMQMFESAIWAINGAKKFPLLCHCRAGGHRGPAAAFLAAFRLCPDKFSRGELVGRMRKLKPTFFDYHPKRVYRNTILQRMGLLEHDRREMPLVRWKMLLREFVVVREVRSVG